MQIKLPKGAIQKGAIGGVFAAAVVTAVAASLRLALPISRTPIEAPKPVSEAPALSPEERRARAQGIRIDDGAQGTVQGNVVSGFPNGITIGKDSKGNVCYNFATLDQMPIEQAREILAFLKTHPQCAPSGTTKK